MTVASWDSTLTFDHKVACLRFLNDVGLVSRGTFKQLKFVSSILQMLQRQVACQKDLKKFLLDLYSNSRLPEQTSNSVSSSSQACRTPKERSPKVVERRSPRSPASEKRLQHDCCR